MAAISADSAAGPEAEDGEALAAEELRRLLALERSTLQMLNAPGASLRDTLDAKYLLMRKDLAKLMSKVALKCGCGWDEAHLGMALLDAYRVRTVHSGGMHVELAAVALLAVAIEYSGTIRQTVKIAVSSFVQCWIATVNAMQPATLGSRPEQLDFEKAKLCQAFKLAQVETCMAVDWRLSRATANILLNILIALGLREAEDTIEGARVSEEAWAVVLEDAGTFCRLGFLNSLSCHYGELLLATASIHAARRINGVEPVWTAALTERCRVQDSEALELCSNELVHKRNAHAEEEAEEETERKATRARQREGGGE